MENQETSAENLIFGVSPKKLKTWTTGATLLKYGEKIVFLDLEWSKYYLV